MDPKTIALLIAPIATAILISIITKLAPSDPEPSVDNVEIKFKHSHLIKLGASFVLLAWLSIPVFLLTIFLSATSIYAESWLVTSVLATLLISAFIYLTIALFLKCENCTRRLTVQWKKEPPPFSISYLGMAGWSSIILQVLFKNRFVCMHCGKHYRLY